MKVTALRNFSANNVHGYPGYVLTQENRDAIANIFDEMIKEGLILCEDGKPAQEDLSNEGMIDEGPQAKDELPDNPLDSTSPAEAIVEAPKAVQPKSKKKKG